MSADENYVTSVTLKWTVTRGGAGGKQAPAARHSFENAANFSSSFADFASPSWKTTR